jgi:hypothetical protein
VCAPNGGSSWAHLRTVRWNQVGFLDSLTKEMRRATAFERADKKVPDNVEFACVVGNGTVVGDGVVSCRSQWTADLQRQGIPAFPVPTTHWLATRGHKGIEKIVELVREPQPRWDAGKVAAARKQLLLGD